MSSAVEFVGHRLGRTSSLLATLLLARTCLADFSLYPAGVSADWLSTNIGVSVDCITALNETLSCDSTLFRRTKSVDTYFWTSDNITGLCTADCKSSAESWNSLVATSCLNETTYLNGRAIPADTISGRFTEGLDLACTMSSEDSSCLVESQSWVGSGMIYDQDENLILNPSLTAVYDNATLCDECFLAMFKARMNSSYLADTAFNNYMSSELGVLLDWCGEDTAISLKSYTSYSSTSAPPSATASSSVTSTTASSTSTATSCPNQVYDASSSSRLKERQSFTDDYTPENSTFSEAACNNLALAYNVPTGAFTVAADNLQCANLTSGTCLPAECELQQVTSEASTCSSIVSELTVAEGTVTTVQLLTWNPTIMGTCDDLTVGQYICITPPGGSWTPSVANITNATADGGGVSQTYTSGPTTTNGISTPTPIQTGMVTSCDIFHKVQSGETCSSVTDEYDISLDDFYTWNPAVQTDCSDLELGVYVCVGILGDATASTTAATTTNTISTPSPIQTGMTSSCDDFYLVVTGDTCYDIAADHDITLASFYDWNPAVGTDCTDLELNTYVCVGVLSSSSATSSSTAAVITTPSPVQTGMVTSCDDFYYVTSGDTCDEIASEEGIALSSLYAWNPAVGTDCADLYLSYYVCVGVETTAAASTQTAAAARRSVEPATITAAPILR